MGGNADIRGFSMEITGVSSLPPPCERLFYVLLRFVFLAASMLYFSCLCFYDLCLVSAKTTENSAGLRVFFWVGYCLFSFPFRNYAKGHLEALVLVKLCRRIDGGFGSAEGHRSNGLPPRRARRWDLQPRSHGWALKGDTAPQDTLSSGRKTSVKRWACKQLFKNVLLESLPSTHLNRESELQLARSEELEGSRHEFTQEQEHKYLIF